jgi:hypothetical protein
MAHLQCCALESAICGRYAKKRQTRICIASEHFTATVALTPQRRMPQPRSSYPDMVIWKAIDSAMILQMAPSCCNDSVFDCNGSAVMILCAMADHSVVLLMADQYHHSVPLMAADQHSRSCFCKK